MKFIDLPEHLLHNIEIAIAAYQDGLVNECRITSNSEPEISFDDTNSLTFMTPYKLNGKQIMATLKLELTVV